MYKVDSIFVKGNFHTSTFKRPVPLGFYDVGNVLTLYLFVRRNVLLIFNNLYCREGLLAEFLYFNNRCRLMNSESI